MYDRSGTRRQARLDDAVSVVSRCFSAYQRGDVETAVAEMHPNIAWVEPATFVGGGTRHGPAQVADYFRTSGQHWAEVSTGWTPHLVGERTVVVVVRVAGRLVDGRAVRATVADVFTVVDGLITTMTAYADPGEAFASAESSGLSVD